MKACERRKNDVAERTPHFPNTLTSLSLILRKVGLYCAWEDTQGWFCPHRDVFIFHLAGRKRRQWWHRKPDSTPPRLPTRMFGVELGPRTCEEEGEPGELGGNP